MNAEKIPKLTKLTSSGLKKVILDWYDSLINRIDFLAETTLAKYKEGILLDNFYTDLASTSCCQEKNEYPNWFETLEQSFVETYNDEYKIDDKYKSDLFDPKTTTVHEYVNKMREAMLEELKKAQSETLELINPGNMPAIPTQSSIDKGDCENKQKLLQSLFRNKFFAILRIPVYEQSESAHESTDESTDGFTDYESNNEEDKSKTKSPMPFRVYLFVFDFFVSLRVRKYMREIMRTYLKEAEVIFSKISVRFLGNNGNPHDDDDDDEDENNGEDNDDNEKDKIDEDISILNEELILAQMLHSYMMAIVVKNKLAFGHHVIEINMSQLRKFEKCKLIFNQPSIIRIVDRCKSENIKSLIIRAEIKSFHYSRCGTRALSLDSHCSSIYGSLAGFSKLVCLKLKNASFDSFFNLLNLRRLELANSKLTHLSDDAFNALSNLESLAISFSRENCHYNVSYKDSCQCFNLEGLLKLKRLVLRGIINLNFLAHLPPNLSILVYDGLFCGDFNWKLPHLQVLDITKRSTQNNSDGSKINAKLPSLKHLKTNILPSSKILQLYNNELPQLESLSIVLTSFEDNPIDTRLDLSKFPNLKYFEMKATGCWYGRPKLVQSVADLIAPLNQLEELHLTCLELKNSSLEGAFSNAKNLKKLNINANRIKSIDSKTFGGLDNLTDLIATNNCFGRMERKTFFDVFPKLEKLQFLWTYKRIVCI